MSFIAAAISAGGAIIGGIGGAAISSAGMNSAAKTQADAANKAAELQKQEYDQQRQDQQPWRQAGVQALSQLQDPSFQKTFTASDMATNDPGYQFRLEQGQKALERSAAARGGLQSGGTLKGIAQYAQDYASNEYNNAYNRFTNDQTNRFNRLASIAGVGQAATNQIGAAGQNYASNAGQAITGAANATAGAQVASAQSFGNTLSGLTSGIGNNWMQATMMNRMFPGK